RRHGRVADVGVDLHQEVAADDHRLGLGVVDVGRDDGPPEGDLLADEFGLEPFPNGDELHLRRDLAASGVVELGDAVAGLGPQRLASWAPELLGARPSPEGGTPVVAPVDDATLV